jgi:hypothetical protein
MSTETTTTEDALRREIAVLRDELALISGGFEARVQRRLELTEEIERLRAEVGMSRVRQRDELSRLHRKQRDELARLRTLLETVRGDRTTLQDRLTEAESRLRIDGQLLTELIIDSCPVLLTDDAAAHIARDTVDELAHFGRGVTVFRGHLDTPWIVCQDLHSELRSNADSPEPGGRRSAYTDGCAAAPADEVVDASILDDPNDVERDVQYAVLTGSTAVEHPFCVAEATNYADAELIAAHLPGCWIGQRLVITQRWTPVDSDTPIR